MPRRGLTPEAVLEAAASLADADGLEQLTLTRLAAELGVRPPSLFNHVAGLPELRRQLQLRGLREMTARVGRAAVGRSGRDAVLAAAAVVRAFAREHPGVYAAALPSTEAADPEVGAAGRQFVDIFFDVVRQYGFEDVDAVHAVRGLFSTIHGFIMLERAGTFGMPVDVDESFRRLVENYVYTLESAERTSDGVSEVRSRPMAALTHTES